MKRDENLNEERGCGKCDVTGHDFVAVGPTQGDYKYGTPSRVLTIPGMEGVSPQPGRCAELAPPIFSSLQDWKQASSFIRSDADLAPPTLPLQDPNPFPQ